MTSVGPYYEILSIFGVLSLGAGIWVSKEYGWTRGVSIAVFVGLLFGQWWFVEYGLASVLWTIHGFAP